MSDPVIHPTAVIGQRVTVGSGTVVGPYCVIEDDVAIGSDCQFMASAYIGRYTQMGDRNKVFPFATIGVQPQDLKFGGGKTTTVIGDDNVFREQCAIHRGTEQGGGQTTIGNKNLFMVSSHVAHDCEVASHTIFSHAATLAGHVHVGSHATIGAYSGVHQFCRVGDYAFIGGYSVITQDALPFVKSVGNRAKIYGINNIGLERLGFTETEVKNLKSAYRTLFQRQLRLIDALEKLKQDYASCPRVQYLVKFIETSERGIVR
ncbi:MAG: acyl-ACP--UDP-N-acetylglucosamine O-acyltransferase [Acidobacteria bacterium]|nr:acyl-ACP--UDP-N-acetylglucosamine O-acyltransferase [Acidobacteriota bacterium]